MKNYIKFSETEMVLLDMESMVKLDDMGVFCVEGDIYEHNGEEWILDWGAYVFYEEGETDSSRYLYYDQSPLEVAIGNFRNCMSVESGSKQAA